jgi:hypothetical protein
MTHVDENAPEPGRARPGVLEPIEGPIRLEQRILNGVLGIVCDQSSGDRVEPRKLALGEDPKALLRGSVARVAHAISLREDACSGPVIASAGLMR